MAKAFAKQGANLVILARRLERLEELKVELEKENVKVLPVKCDVTIQMKLMLLQKKNLAKLIF